MAQKRKVLIFGERVFGHVQLVISVEHCDIDAIRFPSEWSLLTSLEDYDLVRLDYAAFASGRKGSEGEYSEVHEQEQEIFEKNMLNALDHGTNFCFVYFQEYSPFIGYEIEIARQTQIGFKWLGYFNIRPTLLPQLILHGRVRRNEFDAYLRKWGAAKNTFRLLNEAGFDDLIYDTFGDDNAALGFTIDVRRGKLIYLPCQRDFGRPDDVQECLKTLISSLITYLRRTAAEIPSWADTPLFAKEIELFDKQVLLQTELEGLEVELEHYVIAKRLAFHSEYDFEDAIVDFFVTHLNLKVERDEKYKEDYWILNDNSEKICIVEAKTRGKGFKRDMMYGILKHRADYGLDNTFPALLIANVHQNANSWKDKAQPISAEDCRFAVGERILLARVEDLLYFWNAIDEGRATREQLLEIILNQHGWMEVTKEGTVTIHP